MVVIRSGSGAYGGDAKHFTHVKSIDEEASPRTQESGIIPVGRTTAHDSRGVTAEYLLAPRKAESRRYGCGRVVSRADDVPTTNVMQSLVVYRISTRACHSS